MTTLKNIEKYVNELGSDDLPTFGGTYEGGTHIQQIPDEIAPCILAMLESGQKINSYLEIGVAAGGMAVLFEHYFHPLSIVLIDDNKHHKAALREDVMKGITYQEIIGRSDDEQSLTTLSNMDTLFDAIMIDGDHLYPAVKTDTLLYAPFLRPGGFLLLHDSAIPEWGVQRVVRELKEDRGLSFINEYVSQTHKPCGVALFRKGKTVQ